MVSAKINEIFDSIQGEGPYVGYRQLFIRFCGCNLVCDYCDTKFNSGEIYNVEQLLDIVNQFDLPSIHSISLTGGEPLLHYEFLKEFLPAVRKKIYLETNGILIKPLTDIIDLVDIVSMDIKLNSSAKIGDVFNQHKIFIELARKHKKEVFAKIVFDENIETFEINECIALGKIYDIPLILQPKMLKNKIAVSKEKMVDVFEKFTAKCPNTRLIGQVHKFYDFR